MPRRARRLSLLIGGTVVIVVAAAGVGVWVTQQDSGTTAAEHAARATELHDIAEPTLVTEPAPGAPVATDPEPSTGGGQVEVVTTFAGWDDTAGGLEVDGYVSGVVEAEGTCTLTLRRGDSTVTVDGTAQPDASTMQCGALVVPADRLATGKWDAVLAYRSASSSGAADAVTVEVPAR